MTQLADVVRGLAGRDGVRAVLVTSPDGLPIAQEAAPSLDGDAVAALAITAAQHAGRMASAAACGDLGTAVFECPDGTAILAQVGDGNWVILLVEPELNIGPLLYDLRRHRPALAELL